MPTDNDNMAQTMPYFPVVQDNYDTLIKESTLNALKKMSKQQLKDHQTVADTVVSEVAAEVRHRNANAATASFMVGNRQREKGWPIPKQLSNSQIAIIMLYTYPIRRIRSDDESNLEKDRDMLGIYVETGVNRGLYDVSDYTFENIVLSYRNSLNRSELKDVHNLVFIQAEVSAKCADRDLIAVNNGIFNFKTKQLMDFSPNFVFTAKSQVRYNEQAQNLIIHNDLDGTDWDVESWMNGLSDDKDIVELLWQILSATVRPNVSWNTSAWLYAEQGNNGKGCIAELARQLCGSDSYASISLSDFSKEFMLESLMYASAIIVDENDVGVYIDKAANMKAVVTGDVLHINRKYQKAVRCRFRGFMIQCLNEPPRVRDRSDSFLRRQLFIPFEKCFTGKERKYIKDDYLKRPEVLEYVLYRVLHMDIYELSEPVSCKIEKEEYTRYNDPIVDFCYEFFEEYQFAWDLLPYDFLYDLFNKWYPKKNANNSSNIGHIRFVMDIKSIINKHPEWGWEAKAGADRKGLKIHTKGKMIKPEKLILEYGLTNWENASYRGSDPDKICITTVKQEYIRGLTRITNG